MGIASRRWARSSGGGAHCVCASRPLASPPPRAHPGRLGLGSRGLTVDVEFAGLTVTVAVRGVKGKSADVAYMLGPHPDVYTF